MLKLSYELHYFYITALNFAYCSAGAGQNIPVTTNEISISTPNNSFSFNEGELFSKYGIKVSNGISSVSLEEPESKIFELLKIVNCGVKEYSGEQFFEKFEVIIPRKANINEFLKRFGERVFKNSECNFLTKTRAFLRETDVTELSNLVRNYIKELSYDQIVCFIYNFAFYMSILITYKNLLCEIPPLDFWNSQNFCPKHVFVCKIDHNSRIYSIWGVKEKFGPILSLLMGFCELCKSDDMEIIFKIKQLKLPRGLGSSLNKDGFSWVLEDEIKNSSDKELINISRVDNPSVESLYGHFYQDCFCNSPGLREKLKFNIIDREEASSENRLSVNIGIGSEYVCWRGEYEEDSW